MLGVFYVNNSLQALATDPQTKLSICATLFQPFKIFDGPVQLLSPIRQTGLLACVGRDEEVLLKIFDLVSR